MRLESSFLVENNIDKIRIIEEGFYVCFYLSNERIMYTINDHISESISKRYLAVLYGPSSCDYIDHFLRILKRKGIFQEFLEAPDPFLYIYKKGLLNKVSNSLMGLENECSLVYKNSIKRLNCCFC